MKKMWMIAAVACAALMISCGGDKKGAGDVVAKAKEYNAKIEAAYKAGDTATAEKIAGEAEDWLKGLSEADQAKVKQALGE